ncbi:MAG: outer-membrane lipoprotein carrier protein LolA [Muribaculaceae bacterium]|nr:outer-membrane lipoprotein carrier protein LolA [Muribaculaceae bacterium]
MKKILSFLVLVLLSLNAVGQGTTQPQQILNRAVEKITNSKGVVTEFKIYNSGYSGSGRIKSSGNKFNVTLPDVEVWYNGKDLYTYNKNTNETTVVVPSPEELSESNPLTYVTNASKTYNVTFSTVKKNGMDVLELTPKKKGEIKRITLTLRKSDSIPEKIVVEPSSGNPITAEITSFKAVGNLSSSDFEYPESKFSKVEVIDLR